MENTETATYQGNMDLLARIMLIGVAVVIILIGWNLSHSKSKEGVHENMQLLAGIIVADHESALSGMHQFLTQLRFFIEYDPLEKFDCGSLLATVTSKYPYFMNLGTVDRSGNYSCTGVPPKDLGLSVKDDPDFQAMVRGDSFSVSGYRISQITGAPSIRFLEPLHDSSGQMIGGVFATFDVRYLNALPESIAIPSGVTILKFDADGTVFFRYPDPTEWNGAEISDTVLFKEIEEKRKGFSIVPGLDGNNREYYFEPIIFEQAITGYVAVGM